MKGIVKWFNSRKGLGFITGEDGNDYFAHYSNINGEGFRNLKENENVEFDPTPDKDEGRGPVAINITKS